jgi:hypothetical protein
VLELVHEDVRVCGRDDHPVGWHVAAVDLAAGARCALRRRQIISTSGCVRITTVTGPI